MVVKVLGNFTERKFSQSEKTASGKVVIPSGMTIENNPSAYLNAERPILRSVFGSVT